MKLLGIIREKEEKNYSRKERCTFDKEKYEGCVFVKGKRQFLS